MTTKNHRISMSEPLWALLDTFRDRLYADQGLSLSRSGTVAYLIWTNCRPAGTFGGPKCPPPAFEGPEKAAPGRLVHAEGTKKGLLGPEKTPPQAPKGATTYPVPVKDGWACGTCEQTYSLQNEAIACCAEQ